MFKSSNAILIVSCENVQCFHTANFYSYHGDEVTIYIYSQHSI